MIFYPHFSVFILRSGHVFIFILLLRLLELYDHHIIHFFSFFICGFAFILYCNCACKLYL
ncbi:hypothetical protein DFH27DRAFT_587170 [Peziza echinospora]|nr:hypothetical protein DFH27DRAFT_587170 [Peziza echinospora]